MARFHKTGGIRNHDEWRCDSSNSPVHGAERLITRSGLSSPSGWSLLMANSIIQGVLQGTKAGVPLCLTNRLCFATRLEREMTPDHFVKKLRQRLVEVGPDRHITLVAHVGLGELLD